MSNTEHRGNVLKVMGDFFDRHHRTHRPAKTQHSESLAVFERAKTTKSDESPSILPSIIGQTNGPTHRQATGRTAKTLW